MAGRREFELLFKLQASLGSGFNSSMTSAMKATQQLNDEITRINTLSGKIEGFQKQSTALQTNKDKLAQLTEEHDRLQQEMNQTDQPSEALRQKMERNARQIEQTTARIGEQESRLGELGEELRDAGVDTDHLSEENDRLSESYERVRQNQERLATIGQAQQKNAQAISETKTQLAGTIGVIAAAGAALYAGPVQSAMAFESKMADVVKVVDGLKDGTTGELTQDYYKLKEEILDLSTKIPMTAEGLTEIAAAAGQAGIARTEIATFAEDAAKMGIAFDTTADQAGEWMAKWRTSFGLTQTEVVTLSDKINYLGNTSAANALQISEIVTKVGPLGEVAGLANGEIAAMGAIQRLPAAEQAAALKNYFGEESVAAIAPMLTQLGLLEENFNKVGDATKYAESMEAEYGARADTTENKVQLAKNSLSKLSIVIGETFLPFVGEAAEKLSELVTKFSDWAQNNPQLLNTIVKVIAGLAGFKVGALGVKLAFLEIRGGILALQMAFATLKAFQAADGIKNLFGGLGGIAGKFLPIIAIIGGIALAIKLISGNLDKVRGWIQKTFGDGALAVFDKVWAVIQNVGAAIKGVFSGENIGNARNFFQETFGDAGVAVFDALIGVIAQLKEILPGLLDQFANMAVSILPAIATFIGQLLPIIAELVSTFLPILFDVLAQLLPVLGGIISALLDALMPVIQTLTNTILPILMSILQAAMPIITVLASIFTEVLGAAIKAAADIIGGIATILQGLIDFIVGVFTGNWKQAWEGIKSIFKGIFDSLAGLVKAPINAVISIINGAISGINKVGFDVPEWVPVIGGKPFRINIPKIPLLAKGSNYLPEMFIAGENGAELITNARGSKVFTAAQTGQIFNNLNRAQQEESRPTVTSLSFLQSVLLSSLHEDRSGIPLSQTAYASQTSSLAKDSNYSTELIRNTREGKLSTAAQTGQIFDIQNQAQRETSRPAVTALPLLQSSSARKNTAFSAAQIGRMSASLERAQDGETTTIIGILPILQAALTALQTSTGGVVLPQLQMVYTGVTAQGVDASGVTADKGMRSLVIHSAPVFYVGTNAQAEDINEVLRQRDEALLNEFDERLDQKSKDERRRNYD